MCFQFYYDKTQGVMILMISFYISTYSFKKDFACTTNFGSESYEGEEEVWSSLKELLLELKEVGGMPRVSRC